MAVTKEFLKERFEKQVILEKTVLGQYDESEITRLALTGIAAADLYREAKKVSDQALPDHPLIDAVAKFEAEIKAL